MNVLQRRTFRSLMFFIAMSVLPEPLYADETDEGIYIGLGVGVAQISEDVIFFNDNSTAFKVLAGYQLNEYVSLEGSYVTLDDYHAYYPFTVDTRHAVANGRGLIAAAVLTMPLNQRFDLRTRGGVLFWKADTDLASMDSSGNDLSFGLGLSFSVNDALGIRIDFDVLSFGDVEANVATAVFEYRF